MKFKLMVILFFVSLFACGTVLSSGFPIRFDQLDLDSDGYVSQIEAKVRSDLTKSWNTIDIDEDNKMDIMEYTLYEGKDRYQPPEEIGLPEIGAALF